MSLDIIPSHAKDGFVIIVQDYDKDCLVKMCSHMKSLLDACECEPDVALDELANMQYICEQIIEKNKQTLRAKK